MKMLKTKHFRRLAVFLVMIAPAVYLFGSLFSYLGGAHGTFAVANEETQPYTEWVPVSGNLTDQKVVGIVSTEEDPQPAEVHICFSWNDPMSDFGHNQIVFGLHANNPYVYSSNTAVTKVTSNANALVYTLNDRNNPAVYYWGQSWSYAYGASFRNLYFDFDGYFGDDPWANNQPWIDFVDYFGPYGVWYVETTPREVAVPSTPQSNSDYLFGQFFAKDNFLVEWGENAISENPRGFAPFGAFWRYLDINVLHLSNDQIGLMGYGYIYYACHVLLFDIGFILVTFFLDFIQKIADKFTGGE